jgi:hypothetical protein
LEALEILQAVAVVVKAYGLAAAGFRQAASGQGFAPYPHNEHSLL